MRTAACNTMRWVVGSVALVIGDAALSADWCTVLPMTTDPAPVPLAAGGSAAIIDVMVVYTPSSRNALGGTAAIEMLIESYVTYTNAAYEAGGVLHRFRLVHTAEVRYTESGNSITDLARLKNPNDGFMDEIHPLRDTWGADLVSLINTSGSAGVAYQMQSLSSAFASEAFSAIGADTGPIHPGLDGTVGINDFLELLANWGACPVG